MAVDDRRRPDRGTRTLMVTAGGDWWHRIGQLPLMLTGLILSWIGWWHVDKGLDRLGLTLLGPAVAILSIWITSVHGTAF